MRGAILGLAAMLAFSPSPAWAGIDCSQYKDTRTGGAVEGRSAHPCDLVKTYNDQADLNEEAATWGHRQAVAFGIAGAMCAGACVVPTANEPAEKACKVAGGLAGVTDLIGEAAVSGKLEGLMGGAAQAALPFLAKAPKKEAGETGEQCSFMGFEIGFRCSCIFAVYNGGQAVFRQLRANANEDDARRERQRAKDVVAQNPELKLEGGSGDRPTPTGPVAEFKDPTIKEGTKGESKLTGEKLAELAAEAKFKPLYDQFEKDSKKPVSELFDRTLAGQNPVAAAADMMSGTLGAEGTTAAMQLAAGSEQLKDQLKEEFAAYDAKKGAADDGGYASAGGGGRRPAKSGGGMPDIAALMAGLMPGQPGAEKKDQAQGAGSLGFGKLTPGTKLNNEGFHMPQRSIFEIVDARYQMLSPRFLGGDTVAAPRDPASMMPKNPYLKR